MDERDQRNNPNGVLRIRRKGQEAPGQSKTYGPERPAGMLPAVVKAFTLTGLGYSRTYPGPREQL